MGNAQWEHAAAVLKQLPRLRERVRALERRADGSPPESLPDDDPRSSS
jgi:hypothetical protein